MNTHPPRTDPALATAPRNARSADAAAGIKNLQQLIELRWIAVVGQVFTIEMAHYSLGLKLPLQEMLLVVGCLAVFNVVSLLRLRTGRAVRNAGAGHASAVKDKAGTGAAAVSASGTAR